MVLVVTERKRSSQSKVQVQVKVTRRIGRSLRFHLVLISSATTGGEDRTSASQRLSLPQLYDKLLQKQSS